MSGPIRSFLPHAFVADVARSVRFYERLGFKVENSFAAEGETSPTWCWLSSERGGLMLGQARETVVPEQQRVLFYGYCDDIHQAHAELEDSGIDVGPVTKPFYNPGGEFQVKDPDGYVIWIAQI